MVDSRMYLEKLFFEFERLGYTEAQITAALYDYYQSEISV